MDDGVDAGDAKPQRRRVVNADNNVAAILAGRVANVSIAIPDEPKLRNTRIQKILVESEKDYLHLFSEVTGDVYDIKGRPELDLVTVGAQAVSGAQERPFEYEPMLDLTILYDTARSTFVFSPKAEDKLLDELVEQQEHRCTEIVIIGSRCIFGDHEFNTINPLLHRIWRRFLRVCLLPLLKDEQRMILMEDRINGDIPYTDDFVVDKPIDTDSDEGSGKDRKKKKKRGGNKKQGDGFAAESPTAAGVSGKKTPPTTSSRLKPNASSKKPVFQKKGVSVKNK
ncbi:hypothetical protein B484DRAFT_450052 [Ochromonadaceae sp. CCMP2298]|nr:hypothetical protein B484DRAFT_450052 [Ochromonadaceae sp. CCMP2298]|mmetsp:Transcript_5643/g.12421  ORF Transcript_5643/g.12421 Transcript_5643/m.12421 type:complete len:282 (-) Transcript_5643:179-1024(-)